MPVFYNLSLGAYKVMVHLASPFNQKAKKMIEGRKQVWDVLKAKDVEGCYWIHTPSLGEFEQGRPVIEAIKKADAQAKILVTFFSPSGYDIRKDYPLADCVCYLPFDSASNAKRFISKVKPKVALFVKYDIWYHYLHQLDKAKVPAYLISAIFRPQQVFFKSYGKQYRKALSFYEQIFVQDEPSAELLKTIGVEHSIVAGDSRFDRVYEIVQNAKAYEELETFKGNHQVLVAGSSWPKDEDILIEYIHQSQPEQKFIIAPHEIHDAHVNDICKKINVPYQRWTTLDTSKLNDTKVLILDTMGMLSSIYRYGDIAYIGGGFGVGIHNTLEAATYGIPVLFGPNYQRFKEARDLIAEGASWSVSTAAELKSQLDRLFFEAVERNKAGKSAAAYVNTMRGATAKIMKRLGL